MPLIEFVETASGEEGTDGLDFCQSVKLTRTFFTTDVLLMRMFRLSPTFAWTERSGLMSSLQFVSRSSTFSGIQEVTCTSLELLLGETSAVGFWLRFWWFGVFSGWRFEWNPHFPPSFDILSCLASPRMRQTESFIPSRGPSQGLCLCVTWLRKDPSVCSHVMYS